MDHGADVNAADVDGWTPLLQACNSGFAECVEVLLNGGADTQKAKQVSNLQTSCL
jgi:ankyrin repeat protein